MTKEEVIDALNGVDQVDDLFRAAESQEQHKERARRINEAIAIAAKMLQNATIWTPCTDRMPTEKDANRNGNVNAMYADGSIGVKGVPFEMYGKKYDPIAWSRIEPIGGGNG